VSALWWLPLGLAVVAVVSLYLASRSIGRQLVALRASVEALRRLQPAVEEVRIDAERTGRALKNKGLH
jgi:hypothetical protein